MKDIDATWSGIVSRKLSKIREDRWFTMTEIAEKTWIAQPNISAILSRSRKSNEENFTKIWNALGLPDKQVQEILLSSMYEAMEQEYGTSFAFALKSKFKLSERGVKDVLKFIQDVQKMEEE